MTPSKLYALLISVDIVAISTTLPMRMMIAITRSTIFMTVRDFLAITNFGNLLLCVFFGGINYFDMFFEKTERVSFIAYFLQI